MKYAFLSVLAILIAGCSSGESQFRKGYDFTSVDTIAVVDVLGDMPNEAAKNQMADFFIRELLGKGYSPIERAQVHSLLNEHKFQMSDLTNDRGVAKAGQILNVPVVMIINVPEFRENISVTAKLIDVENGSILWLGTGSGKTGKWLGTLFGAGAGAAGGAVVAGDGNETTGAVIGGVVGGAAGYGLSPQQADKANTIVKKMCADIPARL
jgi:hypothetical protein